MNGIARFFDKRGLTLLFIAFVFVTGGSARGDIASLLMLRPVAILALAYAIATLPREVVKDNRVLLFLAVAWLILPLVQLIPLPPALWQSLPGRELAVSVGAAAGLDEVWRPISLVPWRTLNALFALVVPLAVLLMVVSLSRRDLKPVIYLLLTLVVLSAVLGLLQVIGGTGNAFYTYRITNPDSAVGLFANRNHNAVFLSLGFVFIAAFLSVAPTKAEYVRLREYAGAGAGVLLIPFILTTQSRAGLVIMLLSIGLALWTYRSPASQLQKRRPRKAFDPRIAFAGLAGIGIIGLTVLLTATNAVERLSRTGQEDDELRLQIWPPIFELVGQYMPFGSGLGTFVEIYQTREPAELLQPSYINHAHNDWLEVLMTGGLLAAAVLIIAILFAAVRTKDAIWVRKGTLDGVYRRVGASICLVLAIASVYDYPLRTPALAALFAIGCVFLTARWRELGSSTKSDTVAVQTGSRSRAAMDDGS